MLKLQMCGYQAWNIDINMQRIDNNCPETNFHIPHVPRLTNTGFHGNQLQAKLNSKVTSAFKY